ncbi:putative cytosol aminopeptidase [Rhodobacteraceae bacterium THAF1]|uniref:leucyl aminopeptidase family protein n=1 Tax=Palleronia sp. THAF1 TaxID=2587842 RepID=UPI000F3EC015|nr:leucyl aminopeptidase family protein [Palleronia sp. THAF1]QFU09949.1 putative cytosol aminopeptidase [Palleronia sp. THAF1]VDC17147.1 putative cytosol aminopeptidase [Rhodobacteraceae bacterium THAF1]
MTDDPLRFAPDTAEVRTLYALTPDGFTAWQDGASEPHRAWAEAAEFQGKPGQMLVLPGPNGAPEAALVGLGDASAQARTRFSVAAARATLPAGPWRLSGDLDAAQLDEAALGWLLAGYRFERYATSPAPTATLVVPAGVDAARLEAMAAGEALTRDLINTPARDMGPADLARAATTLADRFDAQIAITDGDALAEGFPLIHTVGQAAGEGRSPRLIDMTWGNAGPRITLVGKGVCFDTGGLNLKPGASMGLMKKDMGGAATVLGLAQMLMETGQPIRLRVLIPAVENAVSGDAFRPGDILPSRKGLTVEINNTDAEGRLVLADALALAGEEETDLTVSMATLTGAARVAVGPDLAPFYTDDNGFAQALSDAGTRNADPLWRMPFWAPYETMIEPGIADLDNAPKGGFAGSITAALFLRRFVTAPRYVHFDIYGWNPSASPARPKGGVGQGARALFAAIEGMV